jgi:membrane-associated phospholipid phosphatase
MTRQHLSITAAPQISANWWQSVMHTKDILVQLLLSAILIVGVYQFYFWCQRNAVAAPRQFDGWLDELIPYRPRWVWIYSCLYYPVIVYINFVVPSPREFIYMATSFLVLLALQMFFFVFFPVATPEKWRELNKGRGRSERFLAFVRRFDASSNCFPSMHVSVATLTAFHLQSAMGPWAFVFPVLIALSCLFTKQHYLVDLPAGAVLGWISFVCFQWLL